jgi:hypothetical protein
MLPYLSHNVARMLHEERIRAAQTPKPEWMYEAALAPRPRHGERISKHVRSLVASALHRLATSVDPQSSTVTP